PSSVIGDLSVTGHSYWTLRCGSSLRALAVFVGGAERVSHCGCRRDTDCHRRNGNLTLLDGAEAAVGAGCVRSLTAHQRGRLAIRLRWRGNEFVSRGNEIQPLFQLPRERQG